MKWLAIASSVLVLAVTAGAAVLVQQGGYDLPNVMGWTAAPAPEAENQPGTQPANQSDSQSTAQSDSQSAGESAAQSAETASAEQSGDAAKKVEAAETAVAALSMPKQPAGSNQRSTFDIARIDPDGVSVFAGQGKPFQSVSVLADGVRVGTAKVDENGEWVLVTEKKIASADPELSIEVGTAPAAADPVAPDAATPEQVASDGEAAAPAVDEQGAESASGDETASPDTADAADRGGSQNDVPSPKVRAINQKMLSDLQEMVDSAGRKDAETAAAAPTAKTAIAERAADTAGSAPTDEAPAGERDEPSKVAAAGTITREAAAVHAADDDKTIPIPIHFVYREATFTPDGEKAANLLLQYVKLGKFPTVTLSGHADERGSPALNMALSKDRLEAVEEHLRSGGYKGRLILLPKGEAEPYTGVDRASLATDDLFQLDRRVELHLEN